MKITMEMTISDLIQTLRWQALVAQETAVAALSEKPQSNGVPPGPRKSKLESQR